jgi:hypothetical protein
MKMTNIMTQTALTKSEVLVTPLLRNPLILELLSLPLSMTSAPPIFFPNFTHSCVLHHTPHAQLSHQCSTPNFLSTNASQSNSLLHLK